MSTVIRAKISKSNPYYLERYRYLELKNFCLQYKYWKSQYEDLDSIRQSSFDDAGKTQKEFQDPVGKSVETREYYYDRMMMLRRAADLTDPVLGNYILEGVTLGVSYEVLGAKRQIPCCRELYYELYRKFFWILDRIRG